MSNFLTLAVVPESVHLEEIERYVARNMEKYSGNIEVPEWEDSCFCVGIDARKAANLQRDKELGDRTEWDHKWQSQRKIIVTAYKLLDKGAGIADLTFWDRLQTEWSKFSSTFFTRGRELLESHPDKDRPDTNCKNCEGTGIYKTTHNPEAKWDWYGVQELYKDVWDVYEAAVSNTISLKTTPVQSIVNNWHVYHYHARIHAVLGPRGEWDEKGEMRSFGLVSNALPLDEWKEKAFSILQKYGNDYVAVGIRCRI